jgi:hypothetical protein
VLSVALRVAHRRKVGSGDTVPFVEEDDYFFLKTVIPSRKATREHLNRGEADAED